MKRSLLPVLALLLFICFSTGISATPVMPSTTKHPIEVMVEKLAAMKTKDYQAMLGHPLSFKERIVFMAARSKARHYVKKGMTSEDILEVQQTITKNIISHKEGERSSLGKTALIFGIGAAACLVIAFFVPFFFIGTLVGSIVAIATGSVALRKNSHDNSARIGKLLGWISLGALVLLVILAAIVLSSWGWN